MLLRYQQSPAALGGAAQCAGPGGNSQVKGNGAALPCLPTTVSPGHLPSPALLFLLALGEHHTFPSDPARWKTRQPRPPPRLDTVPRLCTNTAPCPTIVPVL